MDMIKLRSILKGDYCDLVRLFSDEDVRAYLGGPLTKIDAQSRANQLVADKPDHAIAVVLNDVFIGLISLSAHIEFPGVELSYQLLPEFHGKGYAYTALSQLLEARGSDFVAETQVANVASRKLLQKLGFKEVSNIVRFGAPQVIAQLSLLRP